MAIGYVNTTTNTSGSANTSISANKPTNTAQDHIIIILIALNSDNYAANITPPTGFTQIVTVEDGSYSGSLTAYYKIAGSSEPASYTVNWDNSAEASIRIITYSGNATTNPIDQTNSLLTKTSTYNTSGSITTAANTMVVQSAFMNYIENTGDSFSSWGDTGAGLSWTAFSDVGNTSSSQPDLGSAYAYKSGSGAVEGDVNNSLGGGNVGYIIFNIKEPAPFTLTPIADKTGIGSSYTTPGTYYITVPYGCKNIRIQCWGAGGCGSAGFRANGKYGGGGGGGFAVYNIMYPAPGALVRMIVGAGGTSAGTNNGGNSTGEISDQWGQDFSSIIVQGDGGTGLAQNTTTGGNGGNGTGETTHRGGNGGTGNVVTGTGGGGGGAGTANDGTNGGNSAGGAGGATGGGTGGNGRTGSLGAGSPGSQAGGGGGGAWSDSATQYAGGAGADGRVDYTMDYALNTMIIGSGG